MNLKAKLALSAGGATFFAHYFVSTTIPMLDYVSHGIVMAVIVAGIMYLLPFR